MAWIKLQRFPEGTRGRFPITRALQRLAVGVVQAYTLFQRRIRRDLEERAVVRARARCTLLRHALGRGKSVERGGAR